MTRSPTFTISHPIVRPALRLLCLPYAGGSASIYSGWAKSLPANVEVVAIQPPGRANRLSEKPHTRMESLVEEIYTAVTPLLDVPYVVFGHSLGSRVGFELVRMVRRRGLQLPEHFIASGSPAPNLPAHSKNIHDLPKEQFIQELRELNGTPEAVLAHEELIALLLPLLRADFMVSETYAFSPEPPLDCTLSIFSGEYDREIGPEQLSAWRPHFLGRSEITMFPGDHFFVDSLRPSVLSEVSGVLWRVTDELAQRGGRSSWGNSR